MGARIDIDKEDDDFFVRTVFEYADKTFRSRN